MKQDLSSLHNAHEQYLLFMKLIYNIQEKEGQAD